MSYGGNQESTKDVENKHCGGKIKIKTRRAIYQSGNDVGASAYTAIQGSNWGNSESKSEDRVHCNHGANCL